MLWRQAVDPVRIDHGSSLGVFLIRHDDPADAEMFILQNEHRRIRSTRTGRTDSNGARLILQRKRLTVVDRAASAAGGTAMDRKVADGTRPPFDRHHFGLIVSGVFQNVSDGHTIAGRDRRNQAKPETQAQHATNDETHHELVLSLVIGNRVR